MNCVSKGLALPFTLQHAQDRVEQIIGPPILTAISGLSARTYS